MEVAKDLAKQYGVDEADITESSFGETGVTAYSVSVDTADEGKDMFISDKLAEVLGTLKLD